jgi:hypothetical protein
MRDDNLNCDQLDPELSRFAVALRQTALDADVPNRDQLMFRCGQAAAGGRVRRATGLAVWRRLVSGGIAVASFCLGGLAVHWMSVPQPNAGQTEPPLTAVTSRDTDPPVWKPRKDEPTARDQYAARLIRSGHILFAITAPSDIMALPPRSIVAAAAVPETTPLRAGRNIPWLE